MSRATCRVRDVAALLSRSSGPVDALPEGAVVAAGFIAGRAVPWKAATHDRHGNTIRDASYRSYQAWCEEVAGRALDLRRVSGVFTGPCRLDVTFLLRASKRTRPDVDNLRKAFSDALQGVLIQNDGMVWGGMSIRIWSEEVEEEGAYFSLVAGAEPGAGALPGIGGGDDHG